MGRIFSWEEIIEGRIPTIKDFQIARQRVAVGINNSPKIVGALFLGSILRGDFTIRSDIDVLILYRGNTFEELKEFVLMAKSQFVPLQIIPLEKKMAERGIHTLQEGDFLEHLKWAAENGGIIKENPLKYIRFKEIEPKVVLTNTFRVISNNVAKGICELSFYKGEKKMILLGKLLEAPMRIVRQIVWYKGRENAEGNEEKTLQSYREMVRDGRAIRLLYEILDLDKEYSEILEEISEESNKEAYRQEYEALLHKIEKTSPKVFEFVERNALMFLEK